MRFLVMSDPHIDHTDRELRKVYRDVGDMNIGYRVFFKEVEDYVSSLSERIDGICIVGDISSKMWGYEPNDEYGSIQVLYRLADGSYYDHEYEMYEIPIYYVPGNHDVFAVRERVFYEGETYETSEVEDGYSSSDALGFYKQSVYNLIGNPDVIGDVGVIGGFSWYDYSFDTFGLTEGKLSDTKMAIWGDRFCNFEESDRELSDRYIREFERDVHTAIELGAKRLLVMNHFLPHESFLTETDSYNWNVCNAFMGTGRVHEILAEVVRDYGIEVTCVFGHTHFDYEDEIEGVRYVCNPIGYGFEWNFGEVRVKDWKRRLRECFYVLEI